MGSRDVRTQEEKALEFSEAGPGPATVRAELSGPTSISDSVVTLGNDLKTHH